MSLSELISTEFFSATNPNKGKTIIVKVIGALSQISERSDLPVSFAVIDQSTTVVCLSLYNVASTLREQIKVGYHIRLNCIKPTELNACFNVLCVGQRCVVYKKPTACVCQVARRRLQVRASAKLSECGSKWPQSAKVDLPLPPELLTCANKILHNVAFLFGRFMAHAGNCPLRPRSEGHLAKPCSHVIY